MRLTRRDAVKLGVVGAGAALLLRKLPTLSGEQQATLIRKAIPSSGEQLPVIGLAFSTWAADWAETNFDRNVIAVNVAALAAFGVLWVGKFIIFNEILFKHHHEVLEEFPALDGATGIPT